MFSSVLCVTVSTASFAQAQASQDTKEVRLQSVWTQAIPGAEVIGYERINRRAFVTGASGVVTMVQLSEVTGNPRLVRLINIPGEADLGPAFAMGAEVSHVSVDPAGRGVAAVSVIPANHAQHRGKVVFISTETAKVISAVEVGYNPDGMAFSTDGSKLVVADEGQPQTMGDVFIDPPGSVTVIDIAGLDTSDSFKQINASRVTTLHFSGPVLDLALAEGALRIHPACVDDPALNIEPEYVAIHGRYAYVTLQENNAVARVNLDVPEIDAIFGLGIIEQRIDATDSDGGISITQTVAGMPMPDQIAMIEVDGRLFAITANEGDGRSGPRGSATWEHARLSDLARHGNLSRELRTSRLVSPEHLGRLYVCTFSGDTTGDGMIDRPTMMGTRSMSVWDAATFERIGDSGSSMELAIATEFPAYFNANPDEPTAPDKRSDRRGPEPEGVTTGHVGGRPMAFISIERPGAIAVYDLSNPSQPRLAGLHMSAMHGRTAPEGMAFISTDHAPGGVPLLLVAYEHSGTFAVYQVEVDGLGAMPLTE